MNIYEFCTEWVVAWLLANATDSKACVLDYGCGAGEIVKQLCTRDVGAFGCDVFYEGGDHSKDNPALLGSVIRRMEGNLGAIPFESATFDIEELWLRQRLSGQKQKMVAAWMPTTTQRLIVRKLAGLAIVARKPV